MKNPFTQQSQFELFPGAPGSTPKKQSLFFFNRSFAFSFENVILLLIIFIMGLVVTFSLGIEKGRHVVKNDIRRKKVVRMAEVQPVGIKEEKDLIVQTEVQPGLDVAKDLGVSNQVLVDELSENVSAPEKKVDKMPSLEKIHTIQVASYKQQTMADKEAGELKKLGYEAFTERKGSYSIVCVGNFQNKKEAVSLLKSLKKRYSDCYVRSL